MGDSDDLAAMFGGDLDAMMVETYLNFQADADPPAANPADTVCHLAALPLELFDSIVQRLEPVDAMRLALTHKAALQSVRAAPVTARQFPAFQKQLEARSGATSTLECVEFVNTHLGRTADKWHALFRWLSRVEKDRCPGCGCGMVGAPDRHWLLGFECHRTCFVVEPERKGRNRSVRALSWHISRSGSRATTEALAASGKAALIASRDDPACDNFISCLFAVPTHVFHTENGIGDALPRDFVRSLLVDAYAYIWAPGKPRGLVLKILGKVCVPQEYAVKGVKRVRYSGGDHIALRDIIRDGAYNHRSDGGRGPVMPWSTVVRAAAFIRSVLAK